jgi:transcription elongation GreA/GreB family factor
MSRAFVKESDDAPDEPLPDRPISEHPNYVTGSGLAQLRERVAELEAARLELARSAADDGSAHDRLRYVERDLRYFKRRLETAQQVEPASGATVGVGFGATVAVRDDAGHEYRYRIVGEDEAEPERGLVSWVSPLARVLEGTRVGEHVEWRRPVGALGLTVLAIEAETRVTGDRET